jgi:hypothetical protein
MKRLLLFLLASIALFGCTDDVTSTYSTKYRVMAGFMVASYPELMAVVNNPGQFGYIRQSGDNIVMHGPASEQRYAMDALSKDFMFGLGGLIIGTDYYMNLRCYDLACRNCDRVDRRLTLRDDATAVCAHCGVVYNLAQDGRVEDAGNGLHEKPRSLYRYRIAYTEATGRIQLYN